MRFAHSSPVNCRPAVGMAAAVYVAVSLVPFLAMGFRLRIDPDWLAYARSMLFAIGLFYFLGRLPVFRHLDAFLKDAFLHSLICLSAVMLTVSMAWFALPLQDGLMLQWDRALGYDWLHFAEAVAGTRGAYPVLEFAYHTLSYQQVIIILALSFRGHNLRVASFQLSTLFTLAITALVFGLLPVSTAWSFNTPEIAARAAQLGMLDNWVTGLVGIRNGQIHTLTWGMNVAIIGFPSFHCAAAALAIWHLWRDAVFRVVGLPLNLVMLMSTLVIGGHYLVDAIGGIAVAAASVMLAQRYLRWWIARQHRADASQPLDQPAVGGPALASA